MRELLVRHGFQVRVAGTAEEALRLMRQERPDTTLPPHLPTPPYPNLSPG